MRRTASDIIKDLMARVARLEDGMRKRASHNSVYTVELSEVNAINQLGKKMKSEDLELVLLNALSNNLNSHREALQLSKGLGLTSTNSWLGDRRISQISNILVVNKVLSVEGLGKVLAQYCRDFAPQKERLVLKMLKTIGVSLREYSLDSTQDIFDLIYQTKVDLSKPNELFYIESYKGISYEEEEEEGDYDDGGFSYEYGSYRGYHSYSVTLHKIVYAKGEGYLTLSLKNGYNPIKVHQDYDFIANLIDMNQFEELGGHGQTDPTDDFDVIWPEDGLEEFGINYGVGTTPYIQELYFVSGSFDSNGNLTFYVKWDANGSYEYYGD